MNRTDAAKLLTVMSVYDRRTLGEADVEVWAHALTDMRLTDAVEAAHKHYRESSEWLDPNTLRRLIRAIRNGRLEQVTLPCPPYELASDPVATIEWLNDWRRRIADGETPEQIEEGTRPMPALDHVFPRIPPQALPRAPRISCPSCKAKPGVTCDCEDPS